MRRTACVDLPALPLQLLLRRHPDWRVHPVAVIDQDRPQGKLLWVNDRARTLGILPGMRYAAALSLAGGLRAGVMPPGEIERAVVSLTRLLCRQMPRLDAATAEQVAASLATIDRTAPLAEQMAIHRESGPQCMACHAEIDPVANVDPPGNWLWTAARTGKLDM